MKILKSTLIYSYWFAIFFAASFITSLFCSCTDTDPARSVHIIERPVVKVAAVQNTTDRKTLKASGEVQANFWQPEACKGMRVSTHDSHFEIAGPCAYRLHERVSCRVAGDDLYVFLKKSFAGGAQFSIMLSVEHYKGPGKYRGARLFVLLHEGEAGYRWSNINVELNVGPGERFVEIQSAKLAGEPARRSCQRVSGERWNYQYHCDSAQEKLNAVESTTEIASGRIECLESKAPARE